MAYFKSFLDIAACIAVIYVVYEMVIAGPERDRMKQEQLEQERQDRKRQEEKQSIHASIDILIASIPENEEA